MSPAILVAIIAGASSVSAGVGAGIMQAIIARRQGNIVIRTKRLEIDATQQTADTKAAAEVTINHENRTNERIDKLEIQVRQYQQDITQFQKDMIQQERDCNKRLDAFRETVTILTNETMNNQRIWIISGVGVPTAPRECSLWAGAQSL